jgi:2-polyprenyl-3-methyl-5-hydroxy-6-metoxy-1,4-benzoquinol methylase
MTHAFELLFKALVLRVPPRIFYFAVMNKLHCWAKTGNRRYEFERIYLENSDPWDYRSSAYEHAKYHKTLETILKYGRSDESALEVGCSIGVFTQMLAVHFKRVTALDFSEEALKAATERNAKLSNVRFVHDDVRFMSLGERYSVITCAEILYYVSQKDAPLLCEQLHRHLASDGIIILVSGATIGQPSYFYFDNWEESFSTRFTMNVRDVYQASRPYRIAVFSRRDSNWHN